MKKWILCIILVPLIAVLTFFTYVIATFCFCSDESLSLQSGTYGSFKTDTVISFDNQYRVEIDSTASMIRLNVFNNVTNAIACSFEPVRRWDFWGICFDVDGYNIWIQSGDIGIICYEYSEGEWIYNADAEIPAFIVAKWD